MQMEEGIGRGGYRLIALVFAGLGVLGIAATLAAFDHPNQASFFQWLGFALTSISIVALLSVVLVILGPMPLFQMQRAPRPARAEEREADGVPDEMGDDTDLGIEFSDAEPIPEPAPAPHEPFTPEAFRMPPGPPPRVQPPPVPIVQPRRVPPGSGDWPERKPPSGLTRGEAAKAARAPPAAAPAAPAEPPLVMARTAASAEAAGLPDNMSVGKCGNCGVLLLAPKKRPVRLQCPRCERVHTLT